MKNIDLNKLPGTSKLFNDFINDDFHYNEKIEHIFSKINQRKYDRAGIVKIFAKYPYNKSDKQLENIKLLENENTFAIVSGQQAGFLGGSAYTLYKALDTVRISNILKIQFPEFNFVPIFWVEDNDDDVSEAATVYLNNSSSEAIPYSLKFDENICVSNSLIKDDDLETIKSASNEFAKYPFGENYSKLINEIYQVGRTWSDCFIDLYENLVGDTGMLFLSASELMLAGHFKDLVFDELINFNRTKLSVEKRNEELLAKGYHIQANPSDVNLFYHNGNKRYRINISDVDFEINGEIFSKEVLLDTAKSKPERFSPKVLLRPVFQDNILPTLIYVAGPGEIAYHSQLDYVYKDFDVPKPLIAMRTSATIIEKKVSRNLSKIDKSPEYFLQNFRLIEKELSEELLGSRHELIFSDFISNLEKIYSDLESYLLAIDNQLERTIKGAYVNIRSQIEQLDKKAHSAAKRKNEETINKYKICSNSIFPNEKPQERQISPLVYLAQSESLISELLSFSEISSKHHYFIEI